MGAGVVWTSLSCGAVSSPRRHPGLGTDCADTKERRCGSSREWIGACWSPCAYLPGSGLCSLHTFCLEGGKAGSLATHDDGSHQEGKLTEPFGHQPSQPWHQQVTHQDNQGGKFSFRAPEKFCLGQSFRLLLTYTISKEALHRRHGIIGQQRTNAVEHGACFIERVKIVVGWPSLSPPACHRREVDRVSSRSHCSSNTASARPFLMFPNRLCQYGSGVGERSSCFVAVRRDGREGGTSVLPPLLFPSPNSHEMDMVACGGHCSCNASRARS